MSTFEQIEAAVADKRVSYKELVEAMCANRSNAERMAKIFADVVLPEDDPKVLRKKYRDEQAEQHGDDKAAIKEAMVAYDKDHKPKTKRVPPPPRVWTDEDKAKIKAKNAYVKAKERDQGDDVTVAELKTLRKEWRKEFDMALPKPEDEQVDEQPDEQAVGELSDDEGSGFEEAESGDDAPEVPKAPEAPKAPEVPKAPEAPSGLTKEEKKLYKDLQAKKATQTEEEKKLYKALKAKAKA
jgi:hypothetical protein